MQWTHKINCECVSSWKKTLSYDITSKTFNILFNLLHGFVFTSCSLHEKKNSLGLRFFFRKQIKKHKFKKSCICMPQLLLYKLWLIIPPFSSSKSESASLLFKLISMDNNFYDELSSPSFGLCCTGLSSRLILNTSANSVGYLFFRLVQFFTVPPVPIFEFFLFTFIIVTLFAIT